MIRNAFFALAITGLVALAPLQSADARIVFDPTNHAANLLQAARALEQIRNQVASLQNEARMLENMAKELAPLGQSSLGAITQSLQDIDNLIQQAEGISFGVEETRVALDHYYRSAPQSAASTVEKLRTAEARWRQALGSYRDTLNVQAEIVGQISADRETLAALIAQSNGSIGSLQATQAGNELLALSAKQQLQIQSLLAAQFRAEALDDARSVKAEEEGRATTHRFLGNGSAYTPH
jgi:P-type conjugative transfer protein TrbJ